MTILSRLLGRLARLPAAETYDVVVERDLKVPMSDGCILLADRVYPRGVESPPTILVRSCYGRRGVFGFLYGRPYAERGFQVVIQSTRGTFGSEGEFEPFSAERADGLATVAWLKQQPWFGGAFAMTGASYLGYVQWALASEAGPELKALGLQVTTAEFQGQTYAGGAFALDTALTWARLMAKQEERLAMVKQIMGGERELQRLFKQLPLEELDRKATGRQAAYFQAWLKQPEPDGDYWGPLDRSPTVKDVKVPLNMIGGWYDIFLPWMLNDYRAQREAGQRPYLLIGPWAHATVELNTTALRETLIWFNAYLRGDRSQLRVAPVRIFVTGANEWRDLADWPPPGRRQQRWHLQPEGGLGPEPPQSSEPDHYRYDPADPTPVLAGPLLMGQALPRDNRTLEERADVLCYTSAPLERDLEVIGPVEADLYIASSLEHTDFFARLCDVDAQGKSMNVCDALQRLVPGQPARATDGSRRVTFQLWPTAHRFRRGHRVRLQISSGAHPRFARNLGSGEPLATGTKLVAAEQTIYHDPEHPSGIELSIGE